MRSAWSALAASLAIGACAQDVDDLPVPRAWSYGTAEVAVVESPAGDSAPAQRSARLREAPPAARSEPVGMGRAVEALGRTLSALVAPDDRRVAAETARLSGTPRRR